MKEYATPDAALAAKCHSVETRILIGNKFGKKEIYQDALDRAVLKLKCTEHVAVRVLFDDYVSQLVGYSFPVKPLVDSEDEQQNRPFQEI